ncbi:MAG TPA: RNA-binding protein [Acidimicrobiia bacterium]|jgi:cold-inducible RNA-binding protein
MSTNLYVGNLAFGTSSADLEKLFAQHGEVASAQVIVDRETGRSRGFGFVEMPDAASARQAIAALDGHDFDGRALKVNIARKRT